MKVTNTLRVTCETQRHGQAVSVAALLLHGSGTARRGTRTKRCGSFYPASNFLAISEKNAGALKHLQGTRRSSIYLPSIRTANC
jgi:hypothetical protein